MPSGCQRQFRKLFHPVKKIRYIFFEAKYVINSFGSEATLVLYNEHKLFQKVNQSLFNQFLCKFCHGAEETNWVIVCIVLRMIQTLRNHGDFCEFPRIGSVKAFDN